MRIALFPGSFDPPHNGHISILNSIVPLFDKVVIGIADNSEKTTFLESMEKWEMWELIIKKECFTNVEIHNIKTLTAQHALRNNIRYLIRGVRNNQDFEYEMNMARVNDNISGWLETIFIPGLDFGSSSIIRELHKFKGDLSDYMPDYLIQYLQKKLG